MTRTLAIAIIAALIQLFEPGSAFGKPMRGPTMAEAVRAPLIVIAKYRDYKSDREIEYFSPPVARYNVARMLRGALPLHTVSVSYQFHDGSACLPLEGWHFSKSTMPPEGSEWILFLDKFKAGVYYTYRGDYGRMPATPENLGKVERMLKAVSASQVRKLVN